MPNGYRSGGRSGYVGGRNVGASPAYARPLGSIYPSVPGTRYRKGQCVAQDPGRLAMHDACVRHTRYLHTILSGVCAAAPQFWHCGAASRAESAYVNHVPESPICSPPAADCVDRRVDGACSRICRGRRDWDGMLTAKRVDSALAEPILARSH